MESPALRHIPADQRAHLRAVDAGLPPPAQRARRTNRPIAAGNTAISRRVADLTRAYLTALGNPTDVALQAQAVAAAEMVALAELMRERALQGDEIDLGELVRLQGAADRAVRKLGIIERKREPAPIDLDDHLRRAEEAVAAESRTSGEGP